MSRTVSRGASLAVGLAAACLLVAGEALAGESRIVFTRRGALVEQSASGQGPAIVLARLPEGAGEARAIETTPDGGLLVIDLGRSAAWLARGPDEPRALVRGPCLARARPAPRGDSVACPAPGGPEIVSTTHEASRPLTVDAREIAFLGAGGFEMIALADEGVIAFDRRVPDERRLLAKPGARSHLLASPDGSMAVAVFGEGAMARVRSFMLDGEGVPRQLGGPGVPIAWSWDSRWVLIQEGILPDGDGDAADDGNEGESVEATRWLPAAPARRKHRQRRPPPPPPPRTRACAARATGGEVKCWNNFEGLGFDPTSTLVLLKRDGALYVGTIAGVRPTPPAMIIEGVDGPATWIPAPAAPATQPPESQPPEQPATAPAAPSKV